MADDIPGLVPVKVFHRQQGQPVKDLLAHLPHYLLAQVYHQYGQPVAEPRGHGVKGYHQPAVEEDALKIHPALYKPDGIDGPAREVGSQKG